MNTIYNGQAVEYEVSFGKEVEDSYITQAWYVENNEPLGESDLDLLQEQEGSTIDQEWYEHKVGEAEFAADCEQDR